MANYRAIHSSYGFRGRHWEKDAVAENVHDDEKINEHFELIPEGEALEKPADESFEPPEPETFSDWQKHESEIEPAPGLEGRTPAKPSKSKAKRK